MRRTIAAYLPLPAHRALALAIFVALGFAMYCSNAALIAG